MKSMPKVLIVCDSPWKENNNIGNTLSNIFKDWPKEKLALIYAKSDLPDTDKCSRFYQISESALVKSVFKKNIKIGREITVDLNDRTLCNEKEKSDKMYRFFRKRRLSIFLIIREFVFGKRKWKENSLDEFVKSFNPDIIFSLAKNSLYINNIQQYVIKKANVPNVLYFVDDVYSFKFFPFSPLNWIYQVLISKKIYKNLKYYNLIYTISEMQRDEYSKKFNRECKMLTKSINFADDKKIMPIEVNKEKYILTYTGNLQMGRLKQLILIGKELEKISSNQKKYFLHIYSSDNVSEKEKRKLLKYNSIKFLGSVDATELGNIYYQSDILVHIESNNLTYRYYTKLSFSTKLVDYFYSGKPILAMGWKKNASINYLAKNRSAIIITSKRKILEVLRKSFNNLSLLNTYAKNAYLLAYKNHNSNVMRKNIINDFKNLIN